MPSAPSVPPLALEGPNPWLELLTYLSQLASGGNAPAEDALINGQVLQWGPQMPTATMPPLGGQQTAADQALYRVMQQYVGGNSDLLPSLLNGNISIGTGPNGEHQTLYDALQRGEITDPSLKQFATHSLNNANLQDLPTPWYANEFVIGAIPVAVGGGWMAAAGAAPAEAGGVGAASAFTPAEIEAGGIGAAGIGTAEGGAALGPSALASFSPEDVAALQSLSAPGASAAPGEVLVGGAPDLAGGATLTADSGAGGPSLATLLKGASTVGTVGSAISKVAGDTGGGTSTLAGGSPELQALYDQLATLALGSQQPRTDTIIEGYNQATKLANASPQTLISSLRGNINALRGTLQQSFEAASRSLGPGGGRQIEREQGKALATAGGNLQGMFQNAIGGGNTAVLQLLQGLRPGAMTSLPQPVTTTNPADFSGLSNLVMGAGDLYRNRNNLPTWLGGGGGTTR